VTSLTAVIPTYNRAGYAVQAVESVLAQRGADIEVVLVDDGSTDETQRVVAGRARRWGERVRYVWQEHAERGVARNRGAAEARGEFVAFLDSDDLWRPDHAERSLRLLARHPEAAGSIAEYGLVDADGRPIRDRVRRPGSEGRSLARDICLKRVVVHPTEAVLRRSVLSNGTGPFDPDIPGAEDWLLWLRLAAEAPLVRLGEPTVWMRVHPFGTYGDPDGFERSLTLATERAIAAGLPRRLGVSDARLRAINRTHCAYAHYHAGQPAAAFRCLGRALWERPAVVRERDFLPIVLRLSAGVRLSRRIRAARQRGSGTPVNGPAPGLGA
jgi:glycosyltransferase involved in cell wall biosynthesis